MKEKKILNEELKDLFIMEFLDKKDKKIKSIHKYKYKLQKEKEEYQKSSLIDKLIFKIKKAEVNENFFGSIYLSSAFSLMIFVIIFFVNLLFLSNYDQISYKPIMLFFLSCFSFFFSFSLLFLPSYFFGSVEKHYFNDKINELDDKIINMFEVEKLIIEQLTKNEEFEKSNPKLRFKSSLFVSNKVKDRFKTVLLKNFDLKEYEKQFEKLEKVSNFIELNDAVAEFK